MGWDSGSEIFDPVCRSIVEFTQASTGIYPADATKILSKLIKQLQESDWDSEYDSLDLFKEYPYVVAAFAENDVHLEVEDNGIIVPVTWKWNVSEPIGHAFVNSDGHIIITITKSKSVEVLFDRFADRTIHSLSLSYGFVLDNKQIEQRNKELKEKEDEDKRIKEAEEGLDEFFGNEHPSHGEWK